MVGASLDMEISLKPVNRDAVMISVCVQNSGETKA